jgi:hypothetical protein
MRFIDNMKSKKLGRAKGKRDVALARLFFEEHNDEPPTDVATRFFSSLGDDVSRANRVESMAYVKTIRGYQKSWMKKHIKKYGERGSSPLMSGRDINLMSGGDINDLPPEVREQIERMMGDGKADVRVFKFDMGELLRELFDEDSGGDAAQSIVEILRHVIAEKTRQEFLEAGYCLGCGGTIDDQGECQSDGDPDWDGNPETAVGLIAAREAAKVSGNHPAKPEDPEAERCAAVARLIGNFDQLLAESREEYVTDDQREAVKALGDSVQAVLDYEKARKQNNTGDTGDTDDNNNTENGESK